MTNEEETRSLGSLMTSYLVITILTIFTLLIIEMREITQLQQQVTALQERIDKK